MKHCVHPSDKLVAKLLPLGFTAQQMADAYRDIGYERDENEITDLLLGSHRGE